MKFSAFERKIFVQTKIIILAILISFNPTGASAQLQDISGRYRCVQLCKGGSAGPAFITHAYNGFDFDLVNEAGEPARAWIDWPGHMWIANWNEGAFFALDGLTIRFANGSVWKRYTVLEQYLERLPPVLPHR